MWWRTRRNQIPSFVRNGRVHLNRWGHQFSRLLAAEVCASAVVMLDTPCSEVVWSVLATHSICQFPLHFPSRVSPCAITFQLESTPRTAIFFSLNKNRFETSCGQHNVHLCSKNGCSSLEVVPLAPYYLNYQSFRFHLSCASVLFVIDMGPVIVRTGCSLPEVTSSPIF